MRRRIAASLRCVIEEAENGSHGPSSEAPVQRRFVLAARPALRDLIERLDADGPVRPRGVAMSLVLLTDASGPLYRGDDPQALPRAALAAASALQDGW